MLQVHVPSYSQSVQCDQIWQNFATLCEFFKTLDICNRVYSAFGKILTYFGKFLTLLGKFSLL